MGNCGCKNAKNDVVEPPEAAPPEAPQGLKFGVYETGSGEAASNSVVDVESDEQYRDDTRRYGSFDEASASAEGLSPADEGGSSDEASASAEGLSPADEGVEPAVYDGGASDVRDELSISESELEAERVRWEAERQRLKEERDADKEQLAEYTDAEYWREGDEDDPDGVAYRQYATGVCVCCIQSHSTPTRVVVPCSVM